LPSRQDTPNVQQWLCWGQIRPSAQDQLTQVQRLSLAGRRSYIARHGCLKQLPSSQKERMGSKVMREVDAWSHDGDTKLKAAGAGGGRPKNTCWRDAGDPSPSPSSTLHFIRTTRVSIHTTIDPIRHASRTRKTPIASTLGACGRTRQERCSITALNTAMQAIF
jgi:hypothetical protein